MVFHSLIFVFKILKFLFAFMLFFCHFASYCVLSILVSFCSVFSHLCFSFCSFIFSTDFGIRWWFVFNSFHPAFILQFFTVVCHFEQSCFVCECLFRLRVEIVVSSPVLTLSFALRSLFCLFKATAVFTLLFLLFLNAKSVFSKIH